VNLKGLPGFQELTKDIFKDKIATPHQRRNIIIAFYEPGCPMCQELRDSLQEFGDNFVNKGLMEAASFNCAKYQGFCQKEARGAIPSVVYFGPSGTSGEKPQRHPGGKMSFKSLSTWAFKVMADFCKVLEHEGSLRKFLSSDDKVPHIIIFSDKKSVSAMMKTLGLEFRGRAAIGVVLADAEEDLATRFRVKQRPALVHVLQEDTLECDHFDKEFKKEHLTRFISRATQKHRTMAEGALRELTLSRWRSGDCTPQDSNFCVLYLSVAGKSGDAARNALRQLAHHLRKDPVKVFFFRQQSVAKAFGMSPGSVILYRPKRKRYKVFQGDTSSVDELTSFVDGAVGGGAPLPELIQSAPAIYDEL